MAGVCQKLPFKYLQSNGRRVRKADVQYFRESFKNKTVGEAIITNFLKLKLGHLQI
ncbi:hypothetical protein KUC3_17480 [Alteromonas sp. KC3]|nr:hypothetical protein KUC3_17480 [Alteromonas sp. KC3]BCO22848.1 hypothetical protein KUC14_17170 [Alteromonas sp. KC14]